MRESKQPFVETGSTKMEGRGADAEAIQAATVALKEAGSKLAMAKQAERVASPEHAKKLAAAQRAYGGTLRALALVAGIGMGGVGVYKGMEKIADYLSHGVMNVVTRITEPFRVSGLSADSNENPPAAVALERSASEHDAVIEGDENTELASEIIITLPPSSSLEAPDATVSPNLFDLDNEGGTAIGEGLAPIIWSDPAFQRLTSPADMERFINEKVEELCPNTGQTGDGCNPYMVKRAVQGHIFERLQASVREGTGNPEHLFQIGRALEKLSPGGESDRTLPYTSLDVAFRSRRPDLINAYLHSGTYDDQAAPARLGGMLTPGRAEAIVDNYRGLNTEDRSLVDRAFRARINELGDGRAAERSALEGAARRAGIDLDVDDFPDEEWDGE